MKFVAVLVAAACLTACGVKPERSTVDEFFASSRLMDKTALQHTATVIFDPQENGIVETFEIAKVSPEENGTKNVTVTAKVKLPGNGGIAQKTILLTLAKGALKNDPAAADRWIVTGFIERAGLPAIPQP